MKLSEMTDAQKNAAVAEIVGRQLYVLVKQGYYYRPGAHGYTSSLSDAWKLPLDEAKKYEMYANDPRVPGNEKVLIETAPIPSYTTDLNACADMERALTSEECSAYHLEIEKIHDKHTEKFNGEVTFECENFYFHVSPEWRTDAFLLVKGFEQ
jgi:hypothetical protein